MPRFRAEEAAARSIVAHALHGTSVVEHDDGSSDGMVDALIHYADGRIASLEIVTDTDAGYRTVWDRILKSGGQLIDAPDLRHTWAVTVAATAQIREIRASIVAILKLIEGEPTPGELTWPDGRRWHDAGFYTSVFEELGILRASPMRAYEAPAKVILSTEPLGGWQGEPDSVAEWVGTFLSTLAGDVPAKLAADGRGERHAFVWAMFTTDYSVVSVLEGEALPATAPNLPAGVTHVWIGAFLGRAQVLHWNPVAGWSSVYRIPADGRISLPPT